MYSSDARLGLKKLFRGVKVAKSPHFYTTIVIAGFHGHPAASLGLNNVNRKVLIKTIAGFLLMVA